MQKRSPTKVVQNVADIYLLKIKTECQEEQIGMIINVMNVGTK